MGNICSIMRKKKLGNQDSKIGDGQNDSISRISIKSNTVEKSNEIVGDASEKDNENCSLTNGSDRTPKMIKFDDTPHYFKLEMAPEVPETEEPNDDSIYQIPIDPTEKYFDLQALELSKKKIVSFETLIFQLINENENIKTDFDKVRAIFTWLTHKDATEAHLDYMREGKEQTASLGELRESPEMYLHGLCIGRYTYAQFFQLLCRYAGIRCKCLPGFAKGNDFKPGMKLEGGKAAQHAWNAAEINEIWYLFDTHWTARRLIGSKNRTPSPTVNGSSFTNSQAIDMFYFMIHPEDMKFSHHPFETKWQLLRNPLSLQEFEKLCIVKPAFFKYGLQFRSHHESIISTNKEIKIELGYNTETQNEKTCFTFTLKKGSENAESYKNTPLSRFGMVETVKIDNKLSKVRFWLRFPEAGDYKMMIFAKSKEDNLFSGVCEYQINVTMNPDVDDNNNNNDHLDGDAAIPEEEIKMKPFPPTQQTSYGRTELLCKYNVKSTWDNETIINSSNGMFEIEFKLKRESSKIPFPRLMARLKCNSIDDAQLTRQILVRNLAPCPEKKKTINRSVDWDIIPQNKCSVKIRGYLPIPEEFALEIYANDPVTESSSFFLIWQHLIICEKAFNRMVPNLTPSYILGVHERFRELNLVAITHTDPLIVLNKESDMPYADLSIRLGIPRLADTEQIPTVSNSNDQHDGEESKVKLPSIRIFGQLIDSKQNEESDPTNCLMLQQIYVNQTVDARWDEIEFLIRLKDPGSFYRLQIYAMPTENEMDSVPLVMSYLIQSYSGLAQSALKGTRYGDFPEQTNQWKEDCRLIRPMSKKISIPGKGKLKEEVFELVVPHAVKVAAVLNDEWIQLENKQNDNKAHWRGKVLIEGDKIKPGVMITLYANYSVRYNSYSPLLEYILS